MDVKPVSHLFNRSQSNPTNLRAVLKPSPSTRTSDVLEVSALSQFVSGLGAEGLKALQDLQSRETPGQEPIRDYLEKLMNAGSPSSNADRLLGFLSGWGSQMGEDEFGALWNQVSKRESTGSLDYLDYLDQVFSLGQRDVKSILESGQDLSNDDYSKLLKSVTDLLRHGVVGTREVDWRGNRTQIFIENQIGSDLARAKPWDRRFPT